MRVGVVAEGPTESILIEALVDGYWPGSEVRRIQPDLTLAAHMGAGWKGVRAWCRENGRRLDAVMTGVEGDVIDVLIVHVDCSMAHNVDSLHPCPPAVDTASALEDVVVRDWLGLSSLPQNVVLMVPSRSTDTWLYVGKFGDEADLQAVPSGVVEVGL